MLGPAVAVSAVVAGSAGCSPALDWREVQPEGSGAVAMFPCRPSHETRTVPLAGRSVALAVHACKAEGAMFAFSHADIGDPALVGQALEQLRQAAVANLSGVASDERPVQVPGMTPHPKATTLEVQGDLPDGRHVKERLAVFSRGTQVYQATVFGEKPSSEALDTFFGGLRLP